MKTMPSFSEKKLRYLEGVRLSLEFGMACQDPHYLVRVSNELEQFLSAALNQSSEDPMFSTSRRKTSFICIELYRTG